MSSYFSVYANKQGVSICLDSVGTTPTRWFRNEFSTLNYDKETEINTETVNAWIKGLEGFIAAQDAQKQEYVKKLQEEKTLLCSAATPAAADNIRIEIDRLEEMIGYYEDEEVFSEIWCARRVLKMVETLRTVMVENEFNSEKDKVTFSYYAD